MMRAFSRCVFAFALLASAAIAQRPLAELVNDLAANDANKRAQAYNELSRRRDPEVVPLLGKRLETTPTEGQQFGLYLLQQQPIEDTRALYTKLLGSDHAKLRIGSAAQLTRHGEKERAAVLCKALGELPATERMMVLTFLHGIDDARLVATMRAWITPNAPGGLVVAVLDQLNSKEKGRSAETALVARSLAETGKGHVRLAALAWLASEPDGEGAATELAKALAADPQDYGHVDSLFEARLRYPNVLGPAFAEAVRRSRSPHELSLRVPLLRATAPESVADALRALLNSTNDAVRSAALAELAAVPDGLTAKDLAMMLADNAPEPRIAAADVLRRRDDVSGLPIVLALAREPGKHRHEAARVLARFRDRTVVPVLLDCLDDANAEVRQNAWAGLQPMLRDLFPYRRFDFAKCGYEPNGANRAVGLQALRAWWQSVP